MKELKDYVRSIENFPQEGIIFRDITSILKDPNALTLAIDSLKEGLKGVDFDYIIGPESRGFIFGVPLAYSMKKGFIPVRKKGKLPLETISIKYDLEYGSSELEIHRDDIKKGQRVVIVDDLIATGGTIEAIVKLLESRGVEIVKICFVMELAGLQGRKKLEKYDINSLIIYEGK